MESHQIAPLALSQESVQRVDHLLAHMSFTEKVGQLNQRLLGWKAVVKKNGRIVATDELKREIDRWGGLGFLYGLYRADPWSGRNWDNGIRPEERAEAFHVLQDEVVRRGQHGIGALMSEEAPHGHQALGGTILPTNLAMGATFDPEAVRQAQECVARELADSGVQIALVSGLDIARDPRWGRCEECYGEDPYMASQFVRATVEGMQGVQRSHACAGGGGVAVVLKHLAAQGEAIGGRNGQSAVIGTRDLHEIHLPAVAAGIRAGALGLMAAYNDIDSVPCCANPRLLKTYVRDECGFNGIVMADGVAVDRLETMTGSIPEAGRAALLAGVNVSLWDQGFASLDRFSDDPQVVQAVDESARRVLLLKDRFGLLPRDHSQEHGSNVSRETSSKISEIHAFPTLVASADQLTESMKKTRAAADRLSHESLVLMKNDGSIPSAFQHLTGTTTKPLIAVVGPLADDFACFVGDYTAPVVPKYQTSVYRELAHRLTHDDVQLIPSSEVDTERAQSLLSRASMTIAVLGGTSERSYSSSFADNGAAVHVGEHGATGGEGVDCADISLPWDQDHLLNSVRKLTHGLVISVVIAGRAHVLTTVLRDSNAVIWAGYAGVRGPQAVVDALTGVRTCSGRLPVTFPSNPGVVPLRYNDRQSPRGVYRDAPNPVLEWFGTGLGSLAGVVLDQPHVEHDSRYDVVSVHVQFPSVEKSSPEAATQAETMCTGSLNLYRRTVGGTVIPRLKELVGSTWLTMHVGEEKTVTWKISTQPHVQAIYEVGDEQQVECS
jgi:beta-glucosidase